MAAPTNIKSPSMGSGMDPNDSESRRMDKPATQEFREHAGRIGRDIREGAANVGEDLRQMRHSAAAAAHEQVDPLERYIRERPLSTVLMACGVGLILGWLFKR